LQHEQSRNNTLASSLESENESGIIVTNRLCCSRAQGTTFRFMWEEAGIRHHHLKSKVKDSHWPTHPSAGQGCLLCVAKSEEKKYLLSPLAMAHASYLEQAFPFEHLHSHMLDESARLKEKSRSAISKANLSSAQLVFIIQA